MKLWYAIFNKYFYEKISNNTVFGRCESKKNRNHNKKERAIVKT